MTHKRGATVQSVERAIAILKSFSLEKPERGVNELGRELGLHKSTVSRLMITLEQGGLLWRNPQTERYRLGVDLIGMATQVVCYMDVRQVARPFLQQLTVVCQDTVNLAVLEAGRIFTLDQFVPQKRHIKKISQVGWSMSPHCTAAGKVLLAHLPQEELAPILQAGLERFTAHTITDPELLRQELARVREQGHATAQEELEEGLNVVAAPIHDHTGQVRATVSVAGPAYRVTPERLPELAERVMDTASRISEKLGYRPGLESWNLPEKPAAMLAHPGTE